MPSRLAAAVCATGRYPHSGRRLLAVLAITAGLLAAGAQAEERPTAAMLLDRMCARRCGPMRKIVCTG